jgi:hypothetical protein
MKVVEMKSIYTTTLAVISIFAKNSTKYVDDLEVAASVPMNIHYYRAVIAGHLPVPLDLVLPYAKAFSIHPGLLFHMWLRDHEHALDDVMKDLIGDFFLDGERELLAKADEVLKASEPSSLSAIIPIIEWFIDEWRKTRSIPPQAG